jgi:pilus assembly protein CpaB
LKLKLHRNWILAGVAGVVGLLAAISVQRYIHDRVESARPVAAGMPMIKIVVAAADLTAGETLTSRNVAVREVPLEWAHSKVVKPDDFSGVENKPLVFPATRGEPILWPQVQGQHAPTFSALLVKGRRAVTVPVDEVSSISGMLAPGDTIDLVVSVRHGGTVKLLPVMQGVRVMATGTQLDGGQGTASKNGAPQKSRTFTTVTLDATPHEAKRIMAAREVGKVTALLRAPGDTALQDTRIDEALALLGLSHGGRGKAPVQVIYGGGSSRQAVRPLPEILGTAPAHRPSHAGPGQEEPESPH